jgi:type III secretion system low calcium response chaperone LcrH/SycD
MTPRQVQFNQADLDEIVKSFIENAGTLKDIRGLADKDMEAIYAMGYLYYNNAKYEKALDVFRFLCFYDHLERRWWMGLAATWQMMKNFEDAIEAYRFAALLDVEDPTPHLHAADCFLAIGNTKDAESALMAVIHWAGEKPEHAAKKERAQALLQLMKDPEGGTSS